MQDLGIPVLNVLPLVPEVLPQAIFGVHALDIGLGFLVSELWVHRHQDRNLVLYDQVIIAQDQGDL
jgi:hypothetical protein